MGFMSVDEFCWADDSVAIFSKDMLDLPSTLEEMGFTGGRVGIESGPA